MTITSKNTITITQQHLIEVLSILFPSVQIKVNARKDSAYVNANNSFIEIDVWLPEIHLGFEFQDSYHYTSTWYSNTPIKEIQDKDKYKDQTIRNKGETLIHIPCWWDGSIDSLSATVSFFRPDLIDNITEDNHVIVSLTPPLHFFKMSTIPHVGELMLASFHQDPSIISSSSDSWWIGEKYDGVRCCWNSIQQEIYTRAAMSVPLSASIISTLPHSLFIDGELWFGRGSFVHSVKLADSDIDSMIDWHYLRLMCFDVPTMIESLSETFEQRYYLLVNNLDEDHPMAILAPRVDCTKDMQLSFLLQNILDNQGEGLILRKPASEYIHGRSPFLIKIKNTRSDMEAIVTEVNADTVQLALLDGTTFQVPQIEHMRVEKGMVVTIASDHYSRRGVPLNATIVRHRPDIEWPSQTLSISPSLSNSHFGESIIVGPSHSHNQSCNDQKQQGEWKSKSEKTNRNLTLKEQKLKAELINFARSRNMNPFVPYTWYSVNKKDIPLKINNYVDTVKQLFPDIGIDTSEFQPLNTIRLRNVVAVRRSYFDKFAKEIHKKDPLSPANWYHIVKYPIPSTEIKSIVQYHYDNNFARAIYHLYPEIGLEQNYLFPGVDERKQFFLNFAKRQGFDPDVAENWYGIHISTFLSQEGGNQVLSAYEMNTLHALQHLFPSLQFDHYQFFHKPRNYWLKDENKRDFFIKYAERKGFDPLVAENWYKVDISDVTSFKGATNIMVRNKGISPALVHLFPDIGLDLKQFGQVPRHHWLDKNNRRIFFEDFAAKNEFDPLLPTNWYSITKSRVIEHMGFSGVLQYYNNLPLALADVFPNIGLDLANFTFYTRKKKIRQ